jgi:cytochrome c-type biogenesis protein CcmH
LVFLLASGIGAVISYVENPAGARRSGETIPLSGPDGETFARLADYARSIGTEQTSSMTTAGKVLPDVDTMIERLAVRLEATPQDVEGWRMLGWSYFHTERYEQAAAAFGRASELDPSSAELRLSYEEAKAKASEGGAEKIASIEAMPQPERDAAIRAMVDGLARRLESSPRDVEGWIRLMRSRVVLGEREVAATAFRKALEVFMDDSAASGTIRAAAIELGLKAE